MRILVRYAGQIIRPQTLSKLFETYGQVESVQPLRGGSGSGQQGTAAVTMPNEDEARAAIDALDGKSLHGQRISVKQATRP